MKTKMKKHRRTGLRKPLNYLKMWADDDFSRRITSRLHVGMVDEELPFGREGGRKSWYIALTQQRDLLKKLGGVKGLPSGKTLLLFEDDVLALVDYLCGNLIEFDDDGRAVNSAAKNYRPVKPLSKAEIAKYAKQIGLRT
jgi:hypothetical protein